MVCTERVTLNTSDIIRMPRSQNFRVTWVATARQLNL